MISKANSLAAIIFLAQASSHVSAREMVLTVKSSAYTSHVAQTDSTPNIAAWGDRLKNSTKSIAVSRDLLYRYGLKHRSKVTVFDPKTKKVYGEYTVLDKMNKRWRRKIDIYMGKDLKRALNWGVKRVAIRWRM